MYSKQYGGRREWGVTGLRRKPSLVLSRNAFTPGLDKEIALRDSTKQLTRIINRIYLQLCAELRSWNYFLLHPAIREVYTSTPKAIRENLMNQCAQILACYRRNCASPSSAGQVGLVFHVFCWLNDGIYFKLYRGREVGPKMGKSCIWAGRKLVRQAGS